MLRFKANGSHQQVDPLVAAELCAPGRILVQVESCDLDGLKRLDVEWPFLNFVSSYAVDEVNLAPGPAPEQPVVSVDDVLRDVYILVAEIRQVGPEPVFAGYKPDVDLIDEA